MAANIDMMKEETENTFTQSERTIYVAGLARNTTDDDLQAYFLKFGSIEPVNHKTDLISGVSRGFAFVTFNDMESYEKAMGTEEHIIKNKKVVVKKAQPKQGIIFIGKLPNEDELSDETIKQFFTKYGIVDGIKHPEDKVRGGKKNFCFVYFKSTDSAKAVLNEGKVKIGQFELEVGRATLNPNNEMAALVKSAQMPGMTGYRPRSMSTFGPMAGYNGLPVMYGSVPYGGYIPAMSPYGVYNPAMQLGFNGGIQGFSSFRGRGRGRGASRGQRNRPY